MKYKILIGALAAVMILSPALAQTSPSENSNLQITMVNQDPSYADPGKTVDLLFKIENTGLESAENAQVELLSEYPFSLTGGESAVKNLGDVRGYSVDGDAYMVEYTVKVDEQATGDSNIRLKYSTGSGDFAIIEDFNVSISDPATNPDVTVKQLTGNQITFNINNVGDNKAGALTVEVPNQEGLKVEGSTTSVLGELESGANSQVSFPISKALQGQIVEVKVHYTDLNGNRRTETERLTVPETTVDPIDVVLQSSSDSSTTFGIVNTGTTAIYSTVVSLQGEGSSQVVGNLDAGDYTLASFESSSPEMTLEIQYTDSLGVRRSVTEQISTQQQADTNMTRPSTGNATSGEMPEGAPGNFEGGPPGMQQTSGGSSTNPVYILVGVGGLALIVGFFGYRRWKRKKQKEEKE